MHGVIPDLLKKLSNEFPNIHTRLDQLGNEEQIVAISEEQIAKLKILQKNMAAPRNAGYSHAIFSIGFLFGRLVFHDVSIELMVTFHIGIVVIRIEIYVFRMC